MNYPFLGSRARFHAARSRVLAFTLIEILVVLFIISIVTSVALISVAHNENKKIESFANDLTQLITLAEEQAMLSPAILGLSFSTNTFQFASFQSITVKKKGWVTLNDGILGSHRIPDSIQVEVKGGNTRFDAESGDEQDEDDDEGENFVPQIIISMNGDVTPFSIYVGKRGEKAQYVITGDADGTITNKSLL